MAWLLDTCIIVDLLRKNQAALDAMAGADELPRVCDVTTMEVYAGMRSQREEREAERLLANFLRVPMNQAVYRQAGIWLKHYRASHSIDIPDALIAATADHHGLDLATRNVKHFPMFTRLKPPY